MPITPEFSLRQDDNYVYLTVSCPNIRDKDIEVVLDGMDLYFWAEPYSLNLKFRHKLSTKNNETAKYNIDTGIFEVKFEKEIPGEDFPELSLLTLLKEKPKKMPEIQVIERSEPMEYTDCELDPNGFGFNCWSTDFFENFEEIIPFITDIPVQHIMELPYRREARMIKENEDFDPDKIINDYNDPQEHNLEANEIFKGEFTPEQSKRLYGYHKKEFLMSEETARKCLWQIAEIVYAVVYDTALFGAEGSCESHWTIGKLSATLSWFDVPISPSDVILTLFRRTLVYPIYRNFHFACDCWRKSLELLNVGRTAVLKCLMKAATMMEKGEHRWRLNRLYIEPMISWIQDLKEPEYREYVRELESTPIPSQEHIDDKWCIDLLEKYALKFKSTKTSL